MVTYLFASVFIIGLLAVAIYFWQKPKQNHEQRLFSALPEPRSLFSEPTAEQFAAASDGEKKQRTAIIERARSNDKSALSEAHAVGDSEFYGLVLDLLIANVDSDSGLLALASYVTRNELPVNNALAQAMLDSWITAPDRSSTAKALHFA